MSATPSHEKRTTAGLSRLLGRPNEDWSSQSDSLSQERFRTIFDQSPFSAQIFAPDGETLRVNQSWRDLWDSDPDQSDEEVLKRYNILKDQQLESKGIMPFIRRAFEGEAVRIPPVFYDPTQTGRYGRARWVEAYLYPVKDTTGALREVVLIHDDVTDHMLAMERCQQSEDRFRQLADSMPQIVWGARPDGFMDYYNERYYEFTGNARGATGDESWQPYIHPDDLPENIERWATALRTGQPFEMQQRFFDRSNGGYRWHLSRAVPTRNVKGEIVRWFGTSTDIHEQRMQAEELRAEKDGLAALQKISLSLSAKLDLKSLLQTLTDTTTQVFGAQFGAFFYNPPNKDATYSLYTISGVGPEKFSSFPMPRGTELFGPTFRGEGIIRLEDVTKDPRYGKNAPFNGMPKGHLPVRSYLAAPVVSRSGEVLGGLFYGHEQTGVFTPKTEELVASIAAQAAVGIDNARLYKQAQEAIANKQESLEELARSNSELEQFAYVASHDLKEPLRMVATYVKLIEQKYRGKLSPEADEYIGYATSGAQRMHNMINDLLAYAQVGRQPRLQTVDTSRVVADVLGLLSSKIQERGATVEVGELPPVHANGTELHQLFQNLIENALKFRGENAPHIEIGSEVNPKGTQFWVKDNGIGIAPEHMDKIFVIFQRLHPKDRYPGTGIGLAICKKIVEHHRGKLIVESEVGKGTTFRFCIPKSLL